MNWTDTQRDSSSAFPEHQELEKEGMRKYRDPSVDIRIIDNFKRPVKYCPTLPLPHHPPLMKSSRHLSVYKRLKPYAEDKAQKTTQIPEFACKFCGAMFFNISRLVLAL